MDLEQKTYRGVTSLKLVEIGELRCKGYRNEVKKNPLSSTRKSGAHIGYS